ncbi:uncharacterized protein LOC127769064 [Oryza glaberrima]|uniref:uncharacterized protein LOC127769064 n=1 Tax=Oryza glaberrima TaxID=4538 RepID=UPI00224C3255|nr:uncharacterized protein LOC127769064 [Oryza glaberrima]
MGVALCRRARAEERRASGGGSGRGVVVGCVAVGGGAAGCGGCCSSRRSSRPAVPCHTHLYLHGVDLLKNVNVEAIVGPQTSAQAKFLAELGEKFLGHVSSVGGRRGQGRRPISSMRDVAAAVGVARRRRLPSLSSWMADEEAAAEIRSGKRRLRWKSACSAALLRASGRRPSSGNDDSPSSAPTPRPPTARRPSSPGRSRRSFLFSFLGVSHQAEMPNPNKESENGEKITGARGNEQEEATPRIFGKSRTGPQENRLTPSGRGG